MASNSQTPSGSRKRKRNEDNWVANKAKRLRNLGKEYFSKATKKIVAGRQVGPPCTCKKKCYELVGVDNINTIHEQYWASGDDNIQASFIQNHSEKHDIKRPCTQDEDKKRSGSWTYHVSVNGKRTVICLQAFANILGIQKRQINRKNAKVTSAGVLIPDGRGRHDNHYRIPVENQQLVKDHINSIPKVTSHYCRRTYPNILYLKECITSMSDLYDIYLEWLRENNKCNQRVSKHYFEDVMKTDEFKNIRLSKPKSDTCKICDIYRLKSSEAESEEIRHSLWVQQQVHHKKADEGYALAKKWETTAGDDTWVIVMDLQAALPTPKLSSNFAFYKRKLWTFNFGIHNLKTGRGHMFVWDEVTAQRGAIEICSCIWKFVTTEVPPTVKKLIIISDNCPGQNKNFFIVMFQLYLIHCRRFEEIIHIFLRPGHTYNKADQDFACIERTLRTQERIYDIYDYISLIKKSRTRLPFIVTKMEQSDFLDFTKLSMMCVKTATPPGVRFSDAHWFRFTQDYKDGYEFATSYAELTVGGHKVRLSPLRGAYKHDFNLNKVEMDGRLAYHEPLKLKAAKIADLRCLVQSCAGQDSMNRYWNRILGQPSEESSVDNDEYDEDDTAGLCDIFDYV